MMSVFRKTKRKKIESLADLGLRDPLAVIPAIEQGVEAYTDELNLIQLYREFELKPGLYSWVAKRLKYQHDIRLNLDEQGSFFWNQIDGNRTLDSVAKALVGQFDMSLDHARKAVMAFTKNLMHRHLLYLIVPQK